MSNSQNRGEKINLKLIKGGKAEKKKADDVKEVQLIGNDSLKERIVKIDPIVVMGTIVAGYLLLKAFGMKTKDYSEEVSKIMKLNI